MDEAKSVPIQIRCSSFVITRTQIGGNTDGENCKAAEWDIRLSTVHYQLSTIS